MFLNLSLPDYLGRLEDETLDLSDEFSLIPISLAPQIGRQFLRCCGRLAVILTVLATLVSLPTDRRLTGPFSDLQEISHLDHCC